MTLYDTVFRITMSHEPREIVGWSGLSKVTRGQERLLKSMPCVYPTPLRRTSVNCVYPIEV